MTGTNGSNGKGELTLTAKLVWLRSEADDRTAATAWPVGSPDCRLTAALRAPARAASVSVT